MLPSVSPSIPSKSPVADTLFDYLPMIELNQSILLYVIVQCWQNIVQVFQKIGERKNSVITSKNDRLFKRLCVIYALE